MEFLDELNKLTNDKFNYLRVSNVEIQKKPPVVTVNFLLPYDILDSLSEEDKLTIKDAVINILPNSMQVEITFSKSYINDEVVKRYVLGYFKEKHPTVMIENSEIDAKVVNGIAFVKINMKSMFYDYFKSMDLLASMTNYMSHKMCNELRLEISDSKKDLDLETDLATEDSITIISRRIRTENHEKIVGKAGG